MGYRKIPNLYKETYILDLFREVYALEKVHGCLREDSMILMSDGSEKPISEVKPGDRVRTYNSSSKEFTDSDVIDLIIQNKTDRLSWYEITLPNGRTIICTEDHPILTERGWVEAKNLTLEDHLISILNKCQSDINLTSQSKS